MKHVVDKIASPLVTPCITPRFVPSCSPALMKELGSLAKTHNLPIQSHLSETFGEIEWVKELHPHSSSYSAVYDEFGLLSDKTIMGKIKVMIVIIFNLSSLYSFKKGRKRSVTHKECRNFPLPK